MFFITYIRVSVYKSRSGSEICDKLFGNNTSELLPTLDLQFFASTSNANCHVSSVKNDRFALD